MKNTLRYLTAIFMILLSACSTATQQEMTPTVDTIPTAVITNAPTKMIRSASPTPPPVLPTSTQDISRFLSKILPNCSDPELSPNQKWAAGFCNNDETWIVSVDQPTKWTIAYGEYYGSKFDSGNGVIAPFYWSPDNQYLYLAIQRGASGPIYFVDGWGLIRLDLTNGNTSEVLSPIQHQYYSFSLSPDGNHLAYILQPEKPLRVNVLDLETNVAKSHSLLPEYNQAGRILWSPNTSKMVLGQATIDVQEIQPNLFSIVAISLANESYKILVSDSPVQMTPETWIDENTLELSDTDGRVWVYNFTDQTLIEKTE